ncbi:RloB family protein [Halorhodospira neutriphila]|uniref:RloB family protein n=1 Tax=Halorhodospira neutriphila TaxID=168379 RepID=UPI001904E9F7|nr:RloB family protein [Halorhodospira neutriphila]
MPQKRKGKSVNQLRRRKKPRRHASERFLIVCEGEKTEPNYFRRLRGFHRLSTMDVSVCGRECQSGPLQVVNYAEYAFNKDRNFDRVYCVFDGDCEPDKYYEALNRLDSMELKRVSDYGKKAGKAYAYAIPSVPCFELWLLLHYECTDSPFGGSCNDVIDRLRNHIPNYRKNDKEIFEKTQPVLDVACQHAQWLHQKHSDPREDDPYTAVHKLIEAVIKQAQ